MGSPVFAQVQVTGLVRDADSGDRLAGATIQVVGTTRGAVANEDGRFSLSIGSVPAELVVRHIGYRTARIEVVSPNVAELDVSLEPVAVALDELVVSGEDPAVGIMRRVLDRKQAFRAGYENTYADVYTRFWLFSEFRPVQVIESLRQAYWRRDGGSREVVRARRKRPPRSGTFRFAGPMYVPNFYDDSVLLGGTRYVTPTHPDALDLYRFRLGGQRMLDDAVVWDIYFTPRNPSRSAFIGHAAVADSLFEILEIDLRPQPSTAVSPPVEVDDVRYAQRFIRLPSGIVVPLDLKTNGYLVFGRLGASYPPARYEQVSAISNYAIDIPVPDSLYADERMQRDNPAVDRSDFLFIRNPTIVPLTPRETESLARIDPRRTVASAFRPEGLLSQYTAVRTTEDPPEEAPESLVEQVAGSVRLWYNRVDGWYTGLAYETAIGRRLRISGDGGYAWDRKRPYFGGALRVPFSLGAGEVALFLEGSSRSMPVGRSSAYDRFWPGLMTYFGYEDYFDYYQRDRGGVGLDVGSSARRFTLRLVGAVERHESVEKNSGFNGWWFRNVQRQNPPITEGRVVKGEASGTATLGPVEFKLGLERALSGVLDGEFEYTAVTGSVSADVVTFYPSRERPNRMRIELIGATHTGDLPYQRAALLDGSPGFYALPGTFRTIVDRSVPAGKLVAGYWEHDFTTALTELFGLWGWAESGWGLVLFGGHGYAYDAYPRVAEKGVAPGLPAQEPSIRLPNGTGRAFHELGFAVTYPFRLPLRVEVTARLDEKVFGITIGRALHGR
jgi:hypothetical protein